MDKNETLRSVVAEIGPVNMGNIQEFHMLCGFAISG
jgi:hypothetical protein